MIRPKNLLRQTFAMTADHLLSSISDSRSTFCRRPMSSGRAFDGVGRHLSATMSAIDGAGPSFVAVRCAALYVLPTGALAVVVLLAGRGSAAATAVAPDSPAIHDGASAPAQAWRAAMEKGDLPALARMHDASTLAFPPDKMKVAGADAIMKGYARLFATYTAHVTFQDAHWVEQPPLVVSWGLFTLTLHPKRGGPDKVTHGRFTDAAVQTDGGWRYLVDHASLPK